MFCNLHCVVVVVVVVLVVVVVVVYIYIYYHHHTVQAASGSEVFALIDGRKNSISASCRVSRPSWALVGAGCSNQMQVAQGQGSVRVCAFVQAAIGCCILLLLVPKRVLT